MTAACSRTFAPFVPAPESAPAAVWSKGWMIAVLCALVCVLVQGPDLNGRYGGLQGIGGLEATVDETSGTVTPVVNDSFGNVVGWISNGTMAWNSARVGSYGVLPGSTAPVYGNTGITLAQSLLWRSHRIDPTGFYYMGARYYEPVSGRFLSPDPLGHAASMSLYDYCNGDPVNGLDPDGRCSRAWSSYGSNTWSTQANLDMAYAMSSYGKTAPILSMQPVQYKPEPVNWSAVADDAYRALFSLPVASTIRAAAEFATGRDLITNQSIYRGDAFGNLMWSTASDLTMAMPMVGAAARAETAVGVNVARSEAVAMGRTMGVVAEATTVGTRGYRYVTEAEIQAIKDTGMLRGGRPGETFFTKDVYKSGASAQERLSLPTTPTYRIEFEITNNPSFLRNGTKVKRDFGQPGKGAEFMTTDPVEVNLINVQPLR